MKRFISLLMVMVLVISLCACGEKNTAETEQKEEVSANKAAVEKNEVRLTASNLFDYLHIEITWDGADVKISTYPIVGGTFNNVEFVIHEWLSASRGMSSAQEFGADVYLKSSDPSYKYVKSLAETGEYGEDYFKGWLISVIKLPADGKYTETHTTISTTHLAEHTADKELTNNYYTSKEKSGGKISPVYVCDALPENTLVVTGTFVPQS